MRVDLPLGVEGVEHLPKTKSTLQNCFNIGENRIIARPGIELLKDTTAVARGSFVWNGALYHVLSQQLVKITNTETGDYTVIGTIAGPQPVRVAIGFNEACIIVQGGASYTLDDADTLTNTSGNSNFVPFVDVCHINGRFVYVPADGDPALVSDVGDAGTIQPLSFFDAEELPDKNNACFNLSNTLYITGTDSIELFRDAGTTPNPFQRVSGARINSGFIGGLVEYSSTFLFIGRDKDQDYGIYAINQGFAEKISNTAIDLVLSSYTQEELSEAVASRYHWRGYDVACFTLRRHSFGFYAGNWHLLDTIFDGVSRPWGGGYITQFDGKYYTAFDDKLGRLAKINTDYGERITHVLDVAGHHAEGEYFTCNQIKLGISQGYNSSQGSVALMMSRDGVTYGPPVYRNLGQLGQYSNELIWNPPGGIGTFKGFMGIRFYTTEDVDFSIDSLVVDIK